MKIIRYSKIKFPCSKAVQYIGHTECGQYINELLAECAGEVIINSKTKELIGYVFVILR